MLRSLVIDIDNDQQPRKKRLKRVARMYLQRFQGPLTTTTQDCQVSRIVKKLDEITYRRTDQYSFCLFPPPGTPSLAYCWMAIKPGESGDSVFPSGVVLVDWVFSRPHIRKKAVMILADEIESSLLHRQGLGDFVVRPSTTAMKWRGGERNPNQHGGIPSVSSRFPPTTLVSSKISSSWLRQQESMLSNLIAS